MINLFYNIEADFNKLFVMPFFSVIQPLSYISIHHHRSKMQPIRPLYNLSLIHPKEHVSLSSPITHDHHRRNVAESQGRCNLVLL